MGTGVPYAIGAQVADPEALVICINGDGSANMDIMHLATAAEYGLSIKVIILDNNSMGIVLQFEDLQGYGHVGPPPIRRQRLPSLYDQLQGNMEWAQVQTYYTWLAEASKAAREEFEGVYEGLREPRLSPPV